MPSISEFKKTKKQDKIKKTQTGASAKPLEPSEKRRPGRNSEELKTKIKVVEVEPVTQENSGTKKADSSNVAVDAETECAQTKDSAETATTKENKVEINFPGSEVLRAKFPQSFKTAENLVSDWVNDGKFEEIPTMGHPLAKAAVQQGLLNAKKIEKKVMASPVTEKVTLQAFSYAMKAQNLVNQMKSKVKKK